MRVCVCEHVYHFKIGLLQFVCPLLQTLCDDSQLSIFPPQPLHLVLRLRTTALPLRVRDKERTRKTEDKRERKRTHRQDKPVTLLQETRVISLSAKIKAKHPFSYQEAVLFSERGDGLLQVLQCAQKLRVLPH